MPIDQSHLPKVLQYTMEKSPEPRPEPAYQTDIDSTLPVEESTESPLSLEGVIEPELPKIEKQKVVPDDIFDKIQKKLVREKKKLNHRKPAPQTRKVKEEESDYQEEQKEEIVIEDHGEVNDELVSAITESYVKFKEAPPPKKYKKKPVSPPPTQAYPPGTKLNKNGKPRKELTDAQKETRKLALAKGRETRRLNALAKKKANGEVLPDTSQPTPVKKSSPIPIPQRSPAPAPAPAPQWNKEDIMEAQLEAIQRYDDIRRARKQKKKEEQAIQKQKDDIKKVVQREMGWQMSAGRFKNCY